MDISALEAMLVRGEGQTLELKKSLSSGGEALQALCAMVNAEAAHGTLVFGIEPNGKVCGIEPGNHDTAQRSLLQAIAGKFEPTLLVQIAIAELDGKTILVVTARRDQRIPYHELDGRAWVREGAANRLLRLSEKAALNRTRDRDAHSGPWQCDRCGSFVGTLSSWEVSSEGMKKTYRCGCGGEYWPLTRN